MQISPSLEIGRTVINPFQLITVTNNTIQICNEGNIEELDTRIVFLLNDLNGLKLILYRKLLKFFVMKKILNL